MPATYVGGEFFSYCVVNDVVMLGMSFSYTHVYGAELDRHAGHLFGSESN